MKQNPLASDLDEIVRRVGPRWEGLRNQNIFLTGGTGFVGCWLLESLAWANRELGLGTGAVVLTRSIERFREKAPHLAGDPRIVLRQGDVLNPFPRDAAPARGSGFRYLIHAATDSDARMNAEAPLEMLRTIGDGTRHALEFARDHATERFLLTSSGAVYGRQPAGLAKVPEDFSGAPDVSDPLSAYAEGKRLAELLCSIASSRAELAAVVVRGFAFIGPYLPLDRHFAAGNFLRDALEGGPVRIEGDGTARRSYMYAAELAVWIWSALLSGDSCRPYNVGSEREVSIAELAREIAAAFDPPPRVEIARAAIPATEPERYVPSTQRARSELGVREEIGLPEAIGRTVAWHRSNREAFAR